MVWANGEILLQTTKDWVYRSVVEGLPGTHWDGSPELGGTSGVGMCKAAKHDGG